MKKILIAAMFAAASLTAGASIAQDGAKASTGQQAEGRIILETARNLIAFGEAKGDALALVTAAKLMTSVEARVLADGTTGEGGPDKAQDFDIEGVLKKAEELSGGDELIAKVAADVRTAAEANSKAVCWWELECYWNGYCEYVLYCW
ncbi:MAG: hypothetical protein KF723_10090 [Rhizobiaceae bacterium]|nr:hypothetical protein [Rhizobiaceae bacterium]